MSGRSRARDRSRPSGGAPQTTWLPWEQLGGQWWDGAFGVTGSPVSSWDARAPSTAKALQATGANQPSAPVAIPSLKNQLALGFDGTSDILVSDTAIALPTFTLVTVVRLGTLKNYTGLFRLAPSETGGGSGSFCLYGRSTGAIEYGDASVAAWSRASTGTPLTSGGAYALIVTCDGTSAGLVVQVGTISGGSISWATAAFGAVAGTFAAPSGTNYLQPGGGYNVAGTSRLIGDLALYGGRAGVISGAQEASLKSYLQSRFA